MALCALSRPQRSRGRRGLIVTPHTQVDQTALHRLERARLIEQRVLAKKVERVLASVREYRRGSVDDTGVRAGRRAAVEAELPPLDWLWSAQERSPAWVDGDALSRRALAGRLGRAKVMRPTEEEQAHHPPGAAPILRAPCPALLLTATAPPPDGA
jgi:hypothetical protein